MRLCFAWSAMSLHGSRTSQELLYLGLGDHPHKGCCDLTVTHHENRWYPPDSESSYQFPICCHHQSYHGPAFCLSCNLIEDGFHPPARHSSIAVKLKQDRVRFRCLHYLFLEVAGPELPQHAGNIFRCFGSGRCGFPRPRNLWGSRLLWDRNNSFRGKVYFSAVFDLDFRGVYARAFQVIGAFQRLVCFTLDFLKGLSCQIKSGNL